GVGNGLARLCQDPTANRVGIWLCVLRFVALPFHRLRHNSATTYDRVGKHRQDESPEERERKSNVHVSLSRDTYGKTTRAQGPGVGRGFWPRSKITVTLD